MLVNDAKDFWKWWSVWGALVLAGLSGLQAWFLVNGTTLVNPLWFSIITLLLAVAIPALRVLKQPEGAKQ